MKIKVGSFLLVVLMLLISGVVLVGVTRGKVVDGRLYHQRADERDTLMGGPFESSGSTARYAVTEAWVEEGTFMFNQDRAEFASPDVAGGDGKYFSLFTPGVSLLAVPFYWLGKTMGVPQITTYAFMSLLGLINMVLVAKLAGRLGASRAAAWLAGIAFLFGTNALAYSQTMTQHHLSVTLLLTSLWLVDQSNSWWRNILLGFVFGWSVMTDIPNLFMSLPVGFWWLSKHIQVATKRKKKVLRIDLRLVTIALSLIPVIYLFGWYNQQLTGSPVTLAQMVGRAKEFDAGKQQQTNEDKSLIDKQFEQKLPLNTRDQMTSLWILLLSNQRGWWHYSPILSLGVVGLVWAYARKERSALLNMMIATVMMNILVYSMFGDPWGGWSFGPRYLIPASALVCIGVGLLVEKWRTKWWGLVLAWLMLSVSVGINVMATLTTTLIPPKVEALNLVEPVAYTMKRNWDLMNEGFNNSLVYQSWAKIRMSSIAYAGILSGIVVGWSLGLIIGVRRTKKGKNDK